MNSKHNLWLLIFLPYMLLALHSASQQKLPQHEQIVNPATGVSETLATYRKQVLSGIRYALSFNIPADKTKDIEATETILFRLKSNTLPLPIDFKEKRDHIKTVSVNDKQIPVVFRNGHVIINERHLKKAANSLSIKFTAGNLSLNRNEDYLYTLLVPDRASTLFPCFDQPDLKARFTLSLTLPAEWKAVSNAPLQDSLMTRSNKTYRYTESDLIPTYLFSFVAGRFHHNFQQPRGRAMNFYHRETDSIKLRMSVDTIFKLHANALGFLEEYTQIKYPFKKFDFAAIPDFQYGGMEHVGAIDYKAATLFLDSGTTRDQENARSNVIAHETAHMWFGDLVTMQWFNDVWMKEVFANFMADKVSRGTQEAGSYELKFLTTHFPRAYSIDRTPGANPIRQQLTNLQEAGTLYGPIIYNKAPVMMRQLERLMGEEAFRNGVREYLKKYSFGNATWPNLVTIFDARTPADLQAWNKVWVNTPGRPQIKYTLQQNNNRITKFTVSQSDERGGSYLLPQFFEIALVYPDKIEEHTVNMNSHQVTLHTLHGKEVPSFIVFNSSGQGYGLFPVDKKMFTHIADFKSPVMRASAYINLYENMLNGYIKPKELLQLYQPLLTNENEELNLSMITGHIADIYWRLVSPAGRITLADSLENVLWKAMQGQTTANKKKLLFKTYQNISQSTGALTTLYTIWKDKTPPDSIRLSEDDYTSLALTLAVKDYPADSILQHQLNRITNIDRKNRLRFIMPALSADVNIRDAFFASLKDQAIRKKESWVEDALGYLHHPLRTSASQKYLKESLEMLQEIQLTGDIFFPAAWLSATFRNYQATDAAKIVTDFLQAHPGYNPKLKAKILQATDPLMRAVRLVK